MIPFFGANAEGGTLLCLDEPSLDTDRGSAFTALVVPADFNFRGGDGFATLRTFTQKVTIATSATFVLTPITDDASGDSQSFAVAGHPSQECAADLYEQGQRGTVSIAVTAHVGITEIGEATQLLVPRRSTRS